MIWGATLAAGAEAYRRFGPGPVAETAAIPRFVKKFYVKNQDRLVYGTDMGIGLSVYELTFRILESDDEHFYAWEHSTYHWPLHGLDLDDEVLKKVYSDNAKKLLNGK